MSSVKSIYSSLEKSRKLFNFFMTSYHSSSVTNMVPMHRIQCVQIFPICIFYTMSYFDVIQNIIPSIFFNKKNIQHCIYIRSRNHVIPFFKMSLSNIYTIHSFPKMKNKQTFTFINTLHFTPIHNFV